MTQEELQQLVNGIKAANFTDLLKGIPDSKGLKFFIDSAQSITKVITQMMETPDRNLVIEAARKVNADITAEVTAAFKNQDTAKSNAMNHLDSLGRGN